MMTLDDVAKVAEIVGALGTTIVAVVALMVSLAALRAQRETLPISATFGFGERIHVDDEGVRWIWAWMRNTGANAYVSDVSPHEWRPGDLDDEFTPNLARAAMRETLPPWLRSATKRRARKAPGVFSPRRLRAESYAMFWVSCPPGVKDVKFTAAMSYSRYDPVRFVDSEWLSVPGEDTATSVIASANPVTRWARAIVRLIRGRTATPSSAR